MVNWAMFVKHERTDPSNLLFQTRQHQQLFIILLADFLSQLKTFNGEPVPLGLQAAPSSARPSDLTFLYYLRQACVSSKLGTEASALRAHIEGFATWLEGETLAEGVNLHAIDIVANIRVPRYRYIKICGDIAKHNLARLAPNVKHIRSLLGASGHPVTEEEAYLAVENFFEWFHDHIFAYHSSLIAEFLNNIRWAIFDYLQDEYARSWHETESKLSNFVAYGFHYPAECNVPVARAMYWELMNKVRAKPWVHRFIIADAFNDLY